MAKTTIPTTSENTTTTIPSSSMIGHNNTTKTPYIVDAIDLHGYTKVEAIYRLTQFLDQVVTKRNRRKDNSSGCWVEVVTGSGSHSQHGREFMF
jgi:DNA-nicking Smr family endonuclease